MGDSECPTDRGHHRGPPVNAGEIIEIAKRSCQAEPVQSSARLILDPLEPRVLLNADTLAVQLASVAHDTQAHDVLVQMVNETVMVGAQAQTVQRVQVVDQTSGGAILAVGDLSEITAVAISIPSGSDTITLDANSFGALAIPKIQVQGDGLTALAIEHSAGNLDWQVNGDGSGGVTGANLAVSFTGVSALDGGAGTDVLHGPAPDTTWQITGPGAGSLATNAGGPVTTFQGFDSLAGAANNQDTFDLHPGGAMSGTIDGGDGGYDSLAYVGVQATDVVSTPSGPSSGTVTADGNTIDYTGLEPVTLPTAASITIDPVALTGTLANATLTLSDVTGSSTELQLTDPGVIEGQTFVAPTASLTIDLGSGGGNTLNLTSIDQRFAAALTTTTEGSGDTVNINTGLVTQGNPVSITADNVTLAANETIDTRLAGGDAGAITLGSGTLTGNSLTLSPGSQLLATAGVGNTPGAVTLSVSNTYYISPLLPIDFTSRSVNLSLSGATIDAGDVTISTQAQDLSMADEAASYAAGFTGTLSSLLSQIPGDVLSGLTGIDASVTLRGANAGITVDNSTITSSGAVSITSTTSAESENQAMAVGLGGLASATGVEIAVGYAKASSTVQTLLTGTTNINAVGDVTVSADGTINSTSTTQASANLVGTKNPNVVQIALAITDFRADVGRFGRERCDDHLDRRQCERIRDRHDDLNSGDGYHRLRRRPRRRGRLAWFRQRNGAVVPQRPYHGGGFGDRRRRQRHQRWHDHLRRRRCRFGRSREQ